MPSAFCSDLSSSLHLLSELQVERAERLVEEQLLRAVDQRAGKGDALALSARELRRAASLVAAELDHGERLLRLGLAFGLGDAFDPEAVGDVLANGHMREERVVLEY
jgi:hypothetical protein